MALGYPCFRLGGHYFSIATIVIAEIALVLFQNWDWAGALAREHASRFSWTATVDRLLHLYAGAMSDATEAVDA